MGHQHALPAAPDLTLPAVLLLGAVGYAVLLTRPASRQWPRRRTASIGVGITLTLWALLGPLAQASHGSFAAHMAQHLVVGMFGPFLAALGAPVRLLLGRGPVRLRPWIGRLLHARYVRVLAHPAVALVLSAGTLPVLYGTGLYEATHSSPWVHALVHLHFFAGGYLFAWVICGPDPAPRRPSVPIRLVTLGAAIVVHATVSQLLYAGVFAVPASGADRRLGATLMYYGGDLVELALAVALVGTWRPGRPERAQHAPRARPVTSDRAR